ncbi:glycerol kinase GlpK [Longimicrobium terrae]|uniref:Glycerol kinase n=1 Tax=Longimicrobium terrae TaxID=1639882 RepID=A0A841GQN5_9BACT|nr:glycerol kinase GlpK [Longimicrobium terrae]MBB4634976.1 glycerol kinase [Longimicrobium terrae]MBB6069370.1 glycerol kinase [Longimicrobium terrae]NNC31823.1 glycerol kinase GlpK [Longimicrobium terrae]
MILSIDQGTTGTTCLVLDREGRVQGRAYSEFTQHFPRPGWVEHDAREIWTVTKRVAHVAAAHSGAGLEGITGIGITNQRETIVVWDRETGEPIHNALVWQDGRTAEACRALRDAGHQDAVRARTGLVIDPYFSGTKLSWLLDHVPGARRRAEAGELAAGTIDSWLVWNLTGGRLHLTDPTNASRTLLYGLESGAWDAEMLSLFGVPAAVLPEIRASSEVYGTTDGDAFGIELPVAGIAGDQQSALYGHGCCTAGEGKNTYGTGAFLLVHTGDRPVPSRHGLLTTAACGPRGERAFALEGSIFIAGAAVQWLRDGLGIVDDAAQTGELAASLASNDGVFFVPAFTGLGAPHWEPEARGTLLGLTRGTTRAHLVRAALEAMAFSTRDVVQAMEADAGVTLPALRVDGGAAANDWMMQFQADVLGIPVRRPAMVEMTARGAAGLAGLATGFWPSPEAFQEARPAESEFVPAADEGGRAALLAGWRRALAAARAWAGYSE